jgi:hypothetical protein
VFLVPAGRDYVKRKSAEARSKGIGVAGSSPAVERYRKSSVQIEIRLAEADLAQARKLAERKGLGYQTLLKMLVHEGLVREGWRS